MHLAQQEFQTTLFVPPLANHNSWGRFDVGPASVSVIHMTSIIAPLGTKKGGFHLSTMGL